MQQRLSASGWGARLREWFPDREFFMRSQGQVRFIKISSRLQMGAAALALALLLGWGISMAAMAWTQYRAQADRSSLLAREARVADAREVRRERRAEARERGVVAVGHDREEAVRAGRGARVARLERDRPGRCASRDPVAPGGSR